MSRLFGSISEMLGTKKSQDRVVNKTPAASPSYEITPEIREILDLVETTTGQVIFVTGAAGTGKSTLINILKKETKKQLAVVAPTGVAAISCGGQTIHSLFQLAPGPQPTAKTIKGMNGLVVKNLEVLIIDEISMVRADLMDAIAASLRINSRNSSTPFAGKTIVLIGDMHQLPPIVSTKQERILFTDRYDTPYFFSAEALKDIAPVTKVLTQSFRQKDQRFIDLLNDVRVGRNIEQAIQTLNSECLDAGQGTGTELTLTTINAKADSINRNSLDRIDQQVHHYEAELEGEWGDRDNQLPAPRSLELKVGAQVMFLKNHANWVNGTIGRIVELGASSAVVSIPSGPFAATVTVEKETWERVKYAWDSETKRISTQTVGSYTQMPFRLAWAVTIHKAQGLTLEKATIDLDRGTFESGQAYVALSRCRTMSGISLSRPLRPSDIKLDEAIIAFYSYLDA